jgi:hypothetical protein
MQLKSISIARVRLGFRSRSGNPAEMCGGCQQITVGCLKDNPRRLGKDRARLVGAVPLKVESQGFKGGGRIHQFLWRRSRAVSNAK